MNPFRLLTTLFAWLAFIVLALAQDLRLPQPFEYTPQLESQARYGDVESQFKIAYSYYQGKNGGPLCHNIGVERDLRLAYDYFKKASEQGHAEATYYVGMFYYQDLKVLSGIKQDQAKARSIFEMAMNMGSATACETLAVCYHYGFGGTININKAKELYEKTAALGLSTSLCNLSFILMDYNHDVKRAIELAQKAADAGNKVACCNLGVWYYNGFEDRLVEAYSGSGFILEHDYDKAAQYYYKAWVMGNEKGRVGLQDCYQQGALGASNYKTFDQWISSLSSTSPSQRPALTWASALSTTSANYSLQVGVKSSSKVTDVKVFLNGQLSRGVNAVPNDGNDFTVNRSIVLSEGNNSIEVEVTNANGSTTLTKNVVYTKRSAPAPTPINNVAQKSQKRLALVIGNAEYEKATKLLNPYNDAKDISAKLRELGFEVIEKHDVTVRSFKEAVRAFGDKAALYDVSLFYYAGHAMENDGKNYLIPVDAELRTLADVEYECVRADYVLDHLEQAKSKMNIIVLDACRNNPISRSWSRSISKGLSSMDPPSGTFIAFSTSPGHTADDGKGRNSPFTGAFLHSLDKPNLPLELFFKEVLQEVREKTSNAQTPWNQSSFYGDFIFNVK